MIDDEFGASAEIHRILEQAGLKRDRLERLGEHVRRGRYIINLREADIDVAARVLAGAFIPTGV